MSTDETEPKVRPWPPPPLPPTPTVTTTITPPILQQQINQILRYLDELYKFQYQSTKWKWVLPKSSITLKAKSELELVSLENGGELNLSLAKISMPDNTEPDIKFVAKIYDLASGSVKNNIVGESPSKLYDLGLTTPNNFAILTVYNASAYEYAWLQLWQIKIQKGEGVTVVLRNDTVKNATVTYAIVEGLMLPEASYKGRIY